LEVTEKDRQYGYDQTKFFADIGVNSGLTAATLGVGCPAAQDSNLAAGTVTTYDVQNHPNPHKHRLTPNNPQTAPRGGYTPGPPEPLQ
jgi:hypothetical protein